MAATRLAASAPTPAAPRPETVSRPIKPLPAHLVENAATTVKAPFDPAIHVDFMPPKAVVMMKDIGLEGHGISPVAASEPFRLFTDDAVRQFRAEIFSKPVLDNCQVSSNLAPNMIRAYAADYGPFAYSVWHHPKVLDIISNVAGVDLTVAMDIDVAHINVSVNDEEVCIAEKNTATGTGTKTAAATATATQTPAFAWHYDSYPFVVVTMLSDCTDMKGGETVLRTASGETMKVRGPSMGTAVVLQGRYIEHQALKAWGGRERVSMVTSFRPKSPFLKDETVLAGLRGITDLSLLYHQYAEYRFQVLETRFGQKRRQLLESFRHADADARKFDLQGIRSFLDEQRQYMEDMLKELVPYPY
ncbi:hypothetical protein A1O3_02956 [Capronia epimyces CBS 606.96]|uniref:Fe2OG dioxygenase domain-containing protein n=1 Tax=Capronia epimyces CBS 606.96 TaxID=1182542 RepID=W9Z5Y2_9EURO|nr:uncharacterized protein A1O3_02956 [Capronia epimyces CBS 606.96]EXJ89889.1 hypothetical protein A1O3_02956 [Capronia epimyces CBS 606.96]